MATKQSRCIIRSLAIAFATLLNHSESFSIKIANRDFPDGFCTSAGKAMPLTPLFSNRVLSLRIAARLMRFGDDICRMHEMKMRSSSFAVLLGVYAQSADMREFCRLSATSFEKRQPYNWIQQQPKTNCRGRRNRRRHLAWEHMKIYRFQTCVLLFLMCLCCYVYGRIMSLRVSPIARLRRLNWTTENYIWAYKNF